YSINKASGDIMAEVEVPARSRYGMSTWIHEGHQYIMLQTGSKLTAMALPGVESSYGGAH
ncbi:MAG: quinoprotein glucose dehydrogenase, partial [Pseudohongiellaceae bacterium]